MNFKALKTKLGVLKRTTQENPIAEDFEAHVKRTFSTDSGRAVLALLVEEYVLSSAFKSCPNETAYLLGKKELVQILLDIITDVE